MCLWGVFPFYTNKSKSAHLGVCSSPAVTPELIYNRVGILPHPPFHPSFGDPALLDEFLNLIQIL